MNISWLSHLMYHKSTVNLWESQLYNVSEALRGQYALMTMMEEMDCCFMGLCPVRNIKRHWIWVVVSKVLL
jgi:hypothetical protein